MDITITINTDNDSFKGQTRSEVVRILSQVVVDVQEEIIPVAQVASGGMISSTNKLRDYNGAVVGKFKIVTD